MTSIVLLDADTLAGAALTSLQPDGCQLTIWPATTLAERLPRCQHADIIISNKVLLDATLLRQCTRLKLICIAATGINNVDLDVASELGIRVCNVRDYALHAVPQHCMALLLALTNQLLPNQQAVQRGDWAASQHFCLHQHPIQSLFGKTLTIIGYGGLGQATARLAQAFGMQICLAERPDAQVLRPGRTAFRQAIAQADVVSLHCPAQPGQDYLLGPTEFSWFKPTALLINTARGSLVDPAALLAALQDGRLAGAALDVLLQEPPPADDLLCNSRLPNLLLSPHVAWATQQSIALLIAQLADNIQQFLQGTPVRVCNTIPQLQESTCSAS